MSHGLHVVLSAEWQSDAIPLDWKSGFVVPLWKGKGTDMAATITVVLSCSVC